MKKVLSLVLAMMVVAGMMAGCSDSSSTSGASASGTIGTREATTAASTATTADAAAETSYISETELDNIYFYVDYMMLAVYNSEGRQYKANSTFASVFLQTVATERDSKNAAEYDGIKSDVYTKYVKYTEDEIKDLLSIGFGGKLTIDKLKADGIRLIIDEADKLYYVAPTQQQSTILSLLGAMDDTMYQYSYGISLGATETVKGNIAVTFAKVDNSIGLGIMYFSPTYNGT